jgi:predicted DNA-binding ribbon-helix-helix protein
MQALTLFNQNFAVAESLLQIYQLFHGLKKIEFKEDLRLAICSFWGAPENTAIQPAANDRVMVMARAAMPIPEAWTLETGLDFLLRETVVVACTALESFFWDVLRENALTIVQARRSGADESLQELTLTLADYMSLQQYEDQDFRLRQIILKNFERKTLYDADSIEKVARILTIKNFWEQIEKLTGEKASNHKRLVGELIQRRNQIAHRADRPEGQEETDSVGLRSINYAWANLRVQAAKSIVNASADLISNAIRRLEAEIESSKQPGEAMKLVKQLSEEIK